MAYNDESPHKVLPILRKALETIVEMEGKTLLGPDSKYQEAWIDGQPSYHEQGANAAFNQAASIAKDALNATSKEQADKEGTK